MLNAASRRECKTCGTFLPRDTGGAASVDAAVLGPASPLLGLLRAERARGVARVFVVTLLVLVVATIANTCHVPETSVSLGMKAAFLLLAAACTIAAWPEVAPLLTSTGGWRALPLLVGGFGIMIAVGAVYFRTFEWAGFPMRRSVDEYLDAGWPAWTPYVMIAVVPSVVEELIFRGYVLARLDEVLSPLEALVVQAALFSVMHLGVVIFPSHFGMGLLFGVLRRRTRSLYPGMALHMSWNAMVVWSEVLGRSFP